jgi:hypothetical protein
MFDVQMSHIASMLGVCVAYVDHIFDLCGRISYRRSIPFYQVMTILQNGEGERGYLMKGCFDRI